MTNQYSNINLSLVIPVYNDQEVLGELNKRLLEVIPAICNDFEIILIDDGSKDNSWQEIKRLKKQNSKIVGLKLTRNFGQANAIAAGLDTAKNEFIVIMDSDLQDPPEFIESLLNKCIETDSDMAIARRATRKDRWLKRVVSKWFNIISYRATSIKVTQGMGVFRVMRKEAYDKVRNIEEVTGTRLSLLYWGGFDYVTVDLNRDERFAGNSGYTIRKMFSLAMDRIFSYSLWPLRLATMLGIITAMLSFVYGVYILVRQLFLNISIPGWTSTNVLIIFLFAVNFIILGIIGEYLGRVYLETKNRPKYLIGKQL